MASSADKLAARIDALEQAVRVLQSSSQIRYSTVPVGDTGVQAPVPYLVGVLNNANVKLQQAQEDLATAQDDLATQLATLSSIHQSIAAPTSEDTAPDGTIWWVHDTTLSGPVVAQFVMQGGVWVSVPITSDVIANLDVGKLTAGSAALAQAVIQKLWTDVFIANIVTAQQVITSESIVDTLVAKTITSPLINGGSIQGASVASVSGSSEVRLDGGEIDILVDGSVVGWVAGQAGGASGGFIAIGNSLGSILIGQNNLPLGGSAQVSITGTLSVDTILDANGLPLLTGASEIQHGSVNLTGLSSTGTTFTVTFPYGFGSVPDVFVTPVGANPQNYSVSVGYVDTTATHVVVANSGGSTLSIRWLAVT